MSDPGTVNMTPEIVDALTQFQVSLNAVLALAVPAPAAEDEPKADLPVKPEAVKKEKPTPKVVTKREVAPSTVTPFIEWFLTAEEAKLYNVKRGQWECVMGYDNGELGRKAHTLVFHSRLLTDAGKSNASHVIAIRPLGSKACIFNASRITYGTGWRDQKLPQQIAESNGAIPIPFENVVRKDDGAGLDLSKLELVEWRGSEDMVIPPVQQQRWNSNTKFHVVNRHFAGATVVRVEDKYFLFDTDREEVHHYGFNPFFTQLPSEVKSVEEAYSVLMPNRVKAAILEGRDVIRQGELFFVPEKDEGMLTKLLNVNDTQSAFFYNQLCGRIDALGAAVYNCYSADRFNAVSKFVKDCETNNAGKLPGDSPQIARKLLAPYLGTLNVQMGLPITYAPVSDIVYKTGGPRIDSGLVDGASHRNTHMERVYRELAVRLNDGNGSGNGEFGIRFEANLGDENGGWSRRHVATAVLVIANAIYARGTVIHTGREHRHVNLPCWHRVYSNTATANWTVSGDVD